MDENITKHCWSKDRKIVLIDYFNFPDVDWDLFPACQVTDYPQLTQFLVDRALEQNIDFPTHVSGNTLDLFLTNFSSFFVLEPRMIKTLSDFTVIKIVITVFIYQNDEP